MIRVLDELEAGLIQYIKSEPEDVFGSLMTSLVRAEFEKQMRPIIEKVVADMLRSSA